MKHPKPCSLLLTIFLLLAGGSAPAAESWLGQLYAAPGGGEHAAGTLAEPVSLEAAFRMAAELMAAADREATPAAASASAPGVRITLRGGAYELRDTLRVDPRMSRPLRVDAHPGETPVVSGGRRLPSQWDMETIRGRTVWTQVLPEVARGEWYFRQLWVNGQRAHVPALPKQGFFQIEGLVIPEELRGQPKAWAEAPSDRFIHAAGDFDPGWQGMEDIWVMVSFSWIHQFFTVAGHDPASRVLELSREAWSFRPWLLASHPAHGNHVNEDHPLGHDPDTFHKPAHYRVHNVFEALGDPGEFHLDRASGKLHYVPRLGEDPRTAEVVAPRLHQLLVIRGRAGQPAKGVVFEGINFSHSLILPDRHLGSGNHPLSSPPTAIHLQHVSHSAFLDCTFSHLGEYALGLMDGCRDIDVVGNAFFDLGTGAVKAFGAHPGNPRAYLPPLYERREEILAVADPREFAARIPHALPEPGSTMRLRITDNTIREGTRFFNAYTAISLNRVRNSVVAFNSIEDHYFNAIRAGSTANLDFTAMDVQVLNNRITDIGQGLPSSNDMGAIYLGGNGLGVLVEGNLVRNVRSTMYGGNGIYVDGGGSCHFTLRNNVVVDCDYQGIHLKGYGHRVENNIVYGCERAFAQMTKVTDEIPFAHVERNILAPRSAVVFTSRTLEPGEWTFYSRNNLLWSLTAGPRVEVSLFGGYGILNPLRMRFPYWRDRHGRDDGSIVAEVAFENSAAGNFTLSPATLAAARKVGFKPFALNTGPRPPESREAIPFRPDNQSALSADFRRQVAFILARMERERAQTDRSTEPDPRPGDTTHVE
jgi:hypothetical protein